MKDCEMSRQKDKHPGRKDLEVSLDGVDFEDAVDALLETPPPPKEETKPKSKK